MIPKLRKEIDRIDKKLIALLARRFAVARRIGAYKKNNGMAVRDARRERELLARRLQLAKTKAMGGRFVRELFTFIIKESSRLQQNLHKKK